MAFEMEPQNTENSPGAAGPELASESMHSFPMGAQASTRSALKTALDQKRRIEHEELVSDVLRLRWLSLIGAIAWLAFAIQDWMVAYIGGSGRLSIYWGVRVGGLFPIGLALWRLRSPRGFTRKSFLALDVATFSIVQAGICLMCIEYGGISSRYVTGVLVALIARASVLAAPWQRGLLIVGVPLGVYPLFMLTARLFLPQVDAQFADKNDFSIFIQTTIVII